MLPKRWQKDENRHVFFAFPPKAQNQQIKAGLLAHLIFAGLLSRLSEKWHSGAKTFPSGKNWKDRLTVAGTAPVLHRIPF